MNFFKALFSTQFLLKLLIIAGIYALLNFADHGVSVSISHYVYGGLELTLKDKR